MHAGVLGLLRALKPTIRKPAIERACLQCTSKTDVSVQILPRYNPHCVSCGSALPALCVSNNREIIIVFVMLSGNKESLRRCTHTQICVPALQAGYMLCGSKKLNRTSCAHDCFSRNVGSIFIIPIVLRHAPKYIQAQPTPRSRDLHKLTPADERNAPTTHDLDATSNRDNPRRGPLRW